MVKDKKGFTLIEILAVVTIIGLLFILVIPKITNSLKNKKSDIDKTTNNIVTLAAKNYVNSNISNFSKEDNNVFCLPISTLTKKGYLESPVKNMTDDKDITNSKSVKITYDDGFKYEIVDKKDCSVIYTPEEPKEYTDNNGNKYKRISYIEATGTQYIDTGVYASKTEPHKIVADFQLTKLTSEQQTVIGYDLNDAKITSNGYLQGNTSYPYIGLNRRTLTLEYSTTDGGASHFITMDTDDGQHAERSSTYWPATSLITIFTNSKNIATRMAKAKMFSAKIYSNGELVRNFVPTVDSNYVACMFDKVTKECFYNVGSGSLLYDYSELDLHSKNLYTDIYAKKNADNISNYTSGDTKEMYKFSHGATSQTPALTDYRYIGDSPNNYVTFDDSLWRIIGVFDVDDGTGNYSKRIKLVKDGGLTESIPYSNDPISTWGISNAETYLNGTFYNSISVSFKSLIQTSRFYLSGAVGVLTAQEELYNAERSNTTYVRYGVADPTYWDGKIGLMYPSDYLYTFAYGVENNCYSDISKCKSDYNGDPTKSWIHNSIGSGSYTFFITAGTYGKNYMFIKMNTGDISSYGTANNTHPLLAAIYISTNTKYIIGDGSRQKPYVIYFD